jgi:hypothetical protein
MLETVGDLLESDETTVFPQPPGMGTTILNANLNFHRRMDIRKKAAQVVTQELHELRDF